MKLQTLKYRIGNLVYNTLQVPRTTMKRHYTMKTSSKDTKYKEYYGKPYKAYLYKKDGTLRTRKVKSLKEFKNAYYPTDDNNKPVSPNILMDSLKQLLMYAKSNDTSHAEQISNEDDEKDQPKREDRRQGQDL